jgi:hypothetical protein
VGVFSFSYGAWIGLLRFIFSNNRQIDVYFLIQSERNTYSETSIINRITSGKVIPLMRNTATDPSSPH